MTRALVLGGGGVTGVAWELGVITALAEAGVHVADADLVVGTSAGAAVAAQITSGAPLEVFVQMQLGPQSSEVAVELDLDAMIEIFSVLADESIEPDQRRAKVGSIALAAETISPLRRREIVAARLPDDHHGEWPEQHVIITAVDAHTGELTLLDRHGDVPLIDAITASCAVPGIWPPSEYGGRRFIDGGVRTPTNADLATGHDLVLVLSPLAQAMTRDLDAEEVPRLEASGASVVVLRVDADAQVAMGANPLDPAMRAPAFEAGARQGEAAAPDLGWLWNDEGTDESADNDGDGTEDFIEQL